jgi:hypothetical protein
MIAGSKPKEVEKKPSNLEKTVLEGIKIISQRPDSPN